MRSILLTYYCVQDSIINYNHTVKSEVTQSCPTLSDPMECSLPGSSIRRIFQARVLQPTRILHPWDFPGKNTGVGYHFLLQEIFLTQGLNPGLQHCRQMLYHLSHQETWAGGLSKAPPAVSSPASL